MGAVSGRGGQRGALGSEAPAEGRGLQGRANVFQRVQGRAWSCLRSLHLALPTPVYGARTDIPTTILLLLIGLNQEEANIILKDQTGTILGLVGHLVSVTAPQPCL